MGFKILFNIYTKGDFRENTNLGSHGRVDSEGPTGKHFMCVSVNTQCIYNKCKKNKRSSKKKRERCHVLILCQLERPFRFSNFIWTQIIYRFAYREWEVIISMKEKRKRFIINTVQKENKITNASLLHRWMLEGQGDRWGGNRWRERTGGEERTPTGDSLWGRAETSRSGQNHLFIQQTVTVYLLWARILLGTRNTALNKPNLYTHGVCFLEGNNRQKKPNVHHVSDGEKSLAKTNTGWGN